MISPNTDDTTELRAIYEALQEKAKELKVALSWVEDKWDGILHAGIAS